jgi:hypothetical protein
VAQRHHGPPLRDWKFADSPLEGAVYCELVSEVKFRCDSGRVMDDSGFAKRCFALEFAWKPYFFFLGAGWAFRL